MFSVYYDGDFSVLGVIAGRYFTGRSLRINYLIR